MVVPSVLAKQISVIIHPSRPEIVLPVEKVRDIYQGKIVRWGSGERIIVVNHQPSSELRQGFYKDLMYVPADSKATTKENTVMRSFTVASSAAMKRLVSQMKDAIGYVESSYVDGRVKAVHEFESKNPWDL